MDTRKSTYAITQEHLEEYLCKEQEFERAELAFGAVLHEITESLVCGANVEPGRLRVRLNGKARLEVLNGGYPHD